MGKKKKSEEKRGRAQEKAAHKADKKKSKKGEGDEDFDAILEEIRLFDLQRTAVTETKCPPPSPRCFGSLVAHPEKQELLLFGGEFFDGKLMRCYNDLFIYSIRQNEWSKWQIPNPPPPRSAHQAVCVPQGGGQMWVFGGEFTAANNESFHHFKDLWMLDLAHAKWQNIKAPGGPSSRSGHRMVTVNRHLVVFGGFHERTRDFLYFNDVYAFSLQSHTWHRVNTTGGPCPRSAPSLSTTPQGSLIVVGGFSRVKMKRDGIQKAVMHSDAWTLVPSETAPSSSAASSSAASSKKAQVKKAEPTLRWKWIKINPAGRGPSTRSGASTVQLSEQRAVLFGGVEDEDEEEKLKSCFLSDLYQLATDGKPPRWFEVNVDELSRQADAASKPRRRRKKKVAVQAEAAAAADGMDCPEEESEYETESEDDDTEEKQESTAGSGEKATLESSSSSPQPASTDPSSDVTVHSGNVFTCVVKGNDPAKEVALKEEPSATPAQSEAASDICEGPTPRMSVLLAAKGGTVFVYGGMFEKGDRQVYLDDMYSLDVLRRSGASGGWKCLVPLRSDALPWLEDDEEDDDDDDDDEDEEEDESEEEEEDRDEDLSDDKAETGGEDTSEVIPGENMAEFYIRTKGSWLEKARELYEAEHADDVPEDEKDQGIKALAFRLAKEAFKLAEA